jgi:D-sedoheptulose 7-phosphate isomerase
MQNETLATLEELTHDLEDHLRVAEATRQLLPALSETAKSIQVAYENGGEVLSFGNGGSAADAQHLAAELVGHYRRDRRPLPARALSVDSSVLTCISNDYDYCEVFARQVTAMAGPADVVVGFTTSGRSPNVVKGLAAAKAAGATTALFSGGDGTPAIEHADHKLIVPSKSTARIQEMHLLMLHLLSEYVDVWAAGTDAGAMPGK